MATWDEHKRLRNISHHGLDFEGVDAIWDRFTITREDIRHRYEEPRYVTFGLLQGRVVALVHTDRDGEMHVISLRRAEPYEARSYLEAAQDHLGEKG